MKFKNDDKKQPKKQQQQANKHTEIYANKPIEIIFSQKNIVKKWSGKRDEAKDNNKKEKNTHFNKPNGIDDVRASILCARGRVGTSFPMSICVSVYALFRFFEQIPSSNNQKKNTHMSKKNNQNIYSYTFRRLICCCWWFNFISCICMDQILCLK